MTDYDSRSVCYGLRIGEFLNLPEQTREKLISLFARVSEASYRRGFVEGVTAHKTRTKKIVSNLSSWQTDQPLSRSRGSDGGEGTSSSERLFAEYPDMAEIGFESWDTRKSRLIVDE